MERICKLFRDYFSAKRPEIFIGQYLPIEDARTDPHLKEVAEFAVSEYKKSAKTCLKSEEVISAEELTVAGSEFKYLQVMVMVDHPMAAPPALEDMRQLSMKKSGKIIRN